VGKAYGKDTGVYSDIEYQKNVKELYEYEGLRTRAIFVSNEQPIEDVVSEIVGIIERCSL
jgi:thymidylate kinase